MSAGLKILNARKQQGLTQEELAALANITARSVQRIEAGETSPRSYTLKAIAKALNIEFEDLNSQAVVAASSLVPSEVQKAHAGEQDTGFLQLLYLSCFSYLVVPYIHFLIPVYLLNKKKTLPESIRTDGNAMIRSQITWVISLTLAMLLLAAYNILGSRYLPTSAQVNYLVPVFLMYLLNAVMISVKISKLKKRAGAVAK